MCISDKVALIITFLIIVQISILHGAPSRKDTVDRYLEARGIKSTPTWSDTHNVKPCKNRSTKNTKLKAYKFPETESPVESSLRDSYNLKKNMKKQPFVFQTKDDPNRCKAINDLRKNIRAKRKLDRNHQNPEKFKTSPNSKFLEKDVFPEVQFPMNAMETWSPVYVNPSIFAEQQYTLPDIKFFNTEVVDSNRNVYKPYKKQIKSKAKQFMEEMNIINEKINSCSQSKKNVGLNEGRNERLELPGSINIQNLDTVLSYLPNKTHEATEVEIIPITLQKSINCDGTLTPIEKEDPQKDEIILSTPDETKGSLTASSLSCSCNRTVEIPNDDFQNVNIPISITGISDNIPTQLINGNDATHTTIILVPVDNTVNNQQIRITKDERGSPLVILIPAIKTSEPEFTNSTGHELSGNEVSQTGEPSNTSELTEITSEKYCDTPSSTVSENPNQEPPGFEINNNNLPAVNVIQQLDDYLVEKKVKEILKPLAKLLLKTYKSDIYKKEQSKSFGPEPKDNIEDDMLLRSQTLSATVITDNKESKGLPINQLTDKASVDNPVTSTDNKCLKTLTGDDTPKKDSLDDVKTEGDKAHETAVDDNIGLANDEMVTENPLNIADGVSDNYQDNSAWNLLNFPLLTNDNTRPQSLFSYEELIDIPLDTMGHDLSLEDEFSWL